MKENNSPAPIKKKSEAKSPSSDLLILLLPVLVSFLFSFLISFCTVRVVTVTQDIPVSRFWITAACFAGSAVGSLMFNGALTKNKVRIVLGGVVPLAAFWLSKTFVMSFKSALSAAAFSHKSVGVHLNVTAAGEADATLFMAYLGVILALSTSMSLMFQTVPEFYSDTFKLLLFTGPGVWLSPALVFLLLMFSMRTFVNEPPMAHFLIIVCMLTLLLLTGSIRGHDPLAASRLSLRFLPAVIGLIVALVLIVSPQNYTRPELSETFCNGIMAIYDRLESLGDLSQKIDSVAAPLWGIPNSGALSEEVDLSQIGPQKKTGNWAMSVCSTGEGVLYLRGAAYAGYENNTWHELPKNDAEYISDYLGCSITNPDDIYEGTVHIRTSRIYPVLFTPYYPSQIIYSYTDEQAEANSVNCLQYGDSYIENSDSVSVYAVEYGTADSGRGLCSGNYSDDVYSDFLESSYLSIPDDTSAALYSLAEEAGITQLPRDQMPSAVADYVKGSAEYSLDTPAMPKGQNFAVWFLTESDTGYCMHFASAAALMLRALDIPARYVTGYVISVKSDNWYNVLDDNAHAWVEYYDPVQGWLALDPTPGDSYYDNHEENNEPTDSTSEPTEDDTTSAETTTTVAPAEIAPNASDSDLTTPSSANNSDGNNQQPTQSETRRTPYVLIILPGAVLLAIAADLLIRSYVLSKRRASFNIGSNNKRAVAMWNYICQIGVFSGISSYSEAYSLSQKAMFSQHELTKEELAVIRACTTEALAAYRKRSSPIKLFIGKFIKFLY